MDKSLSFGGPKSVDRYTKSRTNQYTEGTRMSQTITNRAKQDVLEINFNDISGIDDAAPLSNSYHMSKTLNLRNIPIMDNANNISVFSPKEFESNLLYGQSKMQQTLPVNTRARSMNMSQNFTKEKDISVMNEVKRIQKFAQLDDSIAENEELLEDLSHRFKTDI